MSHVDLFILVTLDIYCFKSNYKLLLLLAIELFMQLVLNKFSLAFKILFEMTFIILADFGFARFLEEGMMAKTLCGTPLYMVSLPYSLYTLY